MKNDGGPAFPESCNGQIISGMTLRDYFAAAAPITWEMAVSASQVGDTVSAQNRAIVWAAMAVLRMEYADAMLAARAKEDVE